MDKRLRPRSGRNAASDILFSLCELDYCFFEALVRFGIDRAYFLIESLGIQKAELGKDRFARLAVPHVNGETEFPSLFPSRQRYTPKYFFIKFPKYDNRPAEILTPTVLFKTDIGAEMAEPYLAFVEKYSRFFLVYLFLLVMPYPKIFSICTQYNKQKRPATFRRLGGGRRCLIGAVVCLVSFARS